MNKLILAVVTALMITGCASTGQPPVQPSTIRIVSGERLEWCFWYKSVKECRDVPAVDLYRWLANNYN